MSEFDHFAAWAWYANDEFVPGAEFLPYSAPRIKTRGRSGLVPLLPFFLFVGTFLAVPTVALFVRATRSVEESTTPAMIEAVSGDFRPLFLYSLRLSALSAVMGSFAGIMLALAISRLHRPSWLRNWVTGFSGVAANLGGVPLAFAFIAALGAQGLFTRILFHWGVDLYGAGFKISTFWGIAVVYLYFQVPLMFLVMMPALDGLRPVWSEANAILGGKKAQYWRLIALPILMPAILGGLLLLFANAFSAYATAYALSSGASRLVPVQIRFFLQGNTITGKGNLGYALAAWMVIVLAAVMGGYLMLRRRAERWRSQ